VTIEGRQLTVKGPKGTLSRALHPDITVTREEGTLVVTRPTEQKTHKQLHGLTRTLVNNMVVGVTQGFTKKLKIVGVGYRGEMKGSTLVLNVGYSKPVEYPLPKSVSGTVSKDGVIELSSIDKELVGDVAARIRKIRKPDSYQGKGIRYIDEVVRLKPGKSAAKA